MSLEKKDKTVLTREERWFKLKREMMSRKRERGDWRNFAMHTLRTHSGRQVEESRKRGIWNNHFKMGNGRDSFIYIGESKLSKVRHPARKKRTTLFRPEGICVLLTCSHFLCSLPREFFRVSLYITEIGDFDDDADDDDDVLVLQEASWWHEVLFFCECGRYLYWYIKRERERDDEVGAVRRRYVRERWWPWRSPLCPRSPLNAHLSTRKRGGEM